MDRRPTRARPRIQPAIHDCMRRERRYPPYNEVNRDYIDRLTTPRGDNTTYDSVFDEALKNITASWAELGEALTTKDPSASPSPMVTWTPAAKTPACKTRQWSSGERNAMHHRH